MEFVVAVSENDVIGRRGALPWRLPADLKRFKALTLGKPVLMGRRTHESIGRPLPGRLNIVLSRSPGYSAQGCRVVEDLEAARAAAAGTGPLMVIGGAEIYRQCLEAARRIHLTLVHTFIEDGDTFFREWRDPAWRAVTREHHEADAGNVFAYSFLTLERAGQAGPLRP
jgi:dihydrofolate reductase